jgi:hypothetical protein
MHLQTVVFAACWSLAVTASCLAGGRILLDPAVEEDPAYRFAAEELAKASGLPVAFGAHAQEGDVVIGGRAPACRAIAESARLPDGIKADGYAIRQLGAMTVVAGADARGDLYGTLWLAERARLDPRALRSLACLREPAVAIREFVDGQGRLEPPGRGFEGWLQECLKLGINTISTQALAQPEIRLAKAYRMNLMAGTAPFASLPVDDIIAQYGDQVSESPGQLCPLKPKVWDLHREQLRAMLRAQPEVDFVRASMGDLPEDYQVHGCRGPNCRNPSGLSPQGRSLRKAEAQRLALQATWDVVVGEFNKTFFISSWGNPPETYPLNTPADYQYIMEHLPDRGIISTVNNTQHDFYLISPFNPIIGMAGRPQDIYFQVTTEYAGAGFLPVYIGPMIRERLARACDTGHTVGVTGRLWEAVGLWTRDVLWTRANMYALFRAAWEPKGDPREWARDWAALTFGPAGADELAEALCLSEELARRAFWVHGFSGEKGPAYAITRRNVITDGTHYMRWASIPHLAAYRKCRMRGKLREALDSAKGALSLRDRMMERWRAARPHLKDAALRDAIDRDFEHFSAVADVLAPYQVALLLWCHTQDPGISTEDLCRSARECAERARETRSAWQKYTKRFDLFRESGLSEMLDVYLRDCAQIAARPAVVSLEPGRPGRVVFSVFNNLAPAGAPVAVMVKAPRGWKVAPAKRAVRLAYGERKGVVFEVTAPAGFQGEGEVIARVDGAAVENAAVRVKVLPSAGAIAAMGKTQQPTTICPRAARPPAINGAIEPGEWAGAAPAWVNYPLTADLSTKDNVFGIAARWMWDDSHFYFAAEIADEALQPLVAHAAVTRADCVSLVFDLSGDRRDDYEIILVHFPDALVAWPVTVDGTQTSRNIANRPQVEPLGRSVALAMGSRPAGPGRVVEAAIPWSLLGGFKPRAGQVIGFACRFNDADKPGRLAALYNWPGRPALPESPYYLSWADVDKPTRFADLIFTR